MRNQEDLRVIKTKRAIKSAFLHLLRQKELDKISVVELTNLAEISKGTFYLHYNDIYALYQEVLLDYITHEASIRPLYAKILTELEVFVRDFFSTRELPKQDEGRYLLKIENIQYCQGLLFLLINAVVESIFASNAVERNEENMMKLRFLIGGMYAQAISMDTIGMKALSESAVQYLASQIRCSFPTAK